MVVCLRGTDQGFQERVFLVTGEGAQIGRNPECEILLNHPTVSRCHCRIDVCPAGVRVKDLGSVNGTWINGVMRMDSWVHPWDVLRIGTVNFVVEFKTTSESRGNEPVSARPFAQAGTTRLMDVGECESGPIKSDDAHGVRPSQITRFTEMFLGRRGRLGNSG